MCRKNENECEEVNGKEKDKRVSEILKCRFYFTRDRGGLQGRGRECAFLARAGPRIALRPGGAVQSCGIYSKSTFPSLGSARWARGISWVLGLLCARGRCAILRNLFEKHTPLPGKRPSGARNSWGPRIALRPGALCNPAESTQKAYSLPWEASCGRAE